MSRDPAPRRVAFPGPKDRPQRSGVAFEHEETRPLAEIRAGVADEKHGAMAQSSDGIMRRFVAELLPDIDRRASVDAQLLSAPE